MLTPFWRRFGSVLMAPRGDTHVLILYYLRYKSRDLRRRPRRDNRNDVWVSSSRRADDIMREHRREGLSVTIVPP